MHARKYSSKEGIARATKLQFAHRVDPRVFGQLVEENDAEVKVISREEAREAANREEEYSSRFHPDTLLGKQGGRTSVRVPRDISEQIGKATLRFHPQRIRQKASQYYVSLAEEGANRPTESILDVETHLTAAFLQTYASIHSVLREARRRLGDDWRPNRILDIGFGPATGMVALNEVFGQVRDWNPERKLSVIIGNPHMKYRALDILSQQQPEFVEADSNVEESIFEESVPEETVPEEAVPEESHPQEPVPSEPILEGLALEEPDPEECVEASAQVYDEGSLQEYNEEPGGVNVASKPSIPRPKIRTVIHQVVPPSDSPAKYDLIIATHQLYRSGTHYPASVDQHTTHLVSLLSPGGVLLFIERGDPKGFESIARSRQIMIRPENHVEVSKDPRIWKDSNVSLKVLAPCSHHGKCPLQVDIGGRKKNAGFFHWCRFAQSVERAKFTLELKKGSFLSQKWDEETPGRGKGGKALSGKGRPGGKSFETANYSYLMVQRSDASGRHEQDPSDQWPRILSSPIKRDGHVIMNMCAPSGVVEQWTVTKSQGKQEYHDARKADGGDLWALGAKVIVKRGGNTSKLKKVTTRSDKHHLKSALREAMAERSEKSQDVAPVSDVIDASWPSPKKESDEEGIRGHDPCPYDDTEDSLEKYFAKVGKQFENSPQNKRVEKKLKGGEYQNEW